LFEKIEDDSQYAEEENSKPETESFKNNLKLVFYQFPAS
jgi:hypothetical protein